MRMLLKITMPHDEFNEAMEDGTAGDKIQAILNETKPEAVYFTELDGQRSSIQIVNVNDASELPSYCEPWFLSFNADVEVHPAMTPEDLANAGLDKLANKWT